MSSARFGWNNSKRGGGTLVAGALGEMNALIENRPSVVLAAVDATSFHADVLRVAANVALASARSDLHLVHVADDLPTPVVLVPPPTGLGVTTLEMLALARTFLEHAAAEARTHFDGRITLHLAAGVAWKEILQVATDIEADTIVVGTHGRSGFKRLFLGSVAEAVVRHATCPVIVARPKGYGTRGSSDVVASCPDCLRAQRDRVAPRPTCTPHVRDERRGRVYDDAVPAAPR